MTVHEHGSPRRVATGCPCNLCVLVRETQQTPRHKVTSVPTGQVRVHVLALLAQGWTLTALAAHVGYGRTTLAGIADGRTLWTSRYIAEDILSVPIKETAA